MTREDQHARESIPSREAILHDDLYEDWKRAGPHLAEYGSEMVGTAVLVFCVVTIVSLFMSSASPLPHLIPPPTLRLLLVGLLLGGVGWLIALSPPGRLSGAHINPAVSLGFWLLGKMHGRDILGYVIGQITGAVIGAWLGVLAAGHWGRAVNDAALHPAVGYAVAFGLEAGTTFVLTLAIYIFVSIKRLIHWAPAAGMVATGILVALDGNLSGAGMNPARWFGPAVSVHLWSDSIAYILGPLIGAALAAGLRRALPFTHVSPHTGKLFHDSRYRSLFRHDTVPSTPPARSR